VRVRLAWCALVLWVASVAVPSAGAQPLIVPLTGHRQRTIEAETLFHTLFDDFFVQPDGTTYVQTGDIPAMWLRDSASQALPYIRFIPFFPALRPLIAGVVEREARNILTDPYANAFMLDYHVWERKWEPDSLAWPILLAWVYERETGDRAIFTPALHRALRVIVSTYECQEHHPTCRAYRYPYRVPTRRTYDPETGLVWGAFRPSDDPVHYRFNIPQNAMVVIALEDLAILARDGYGDVALADRAQHLGERIFLGIERYGIADAPGHGRIYAYETDGYGRARLMDDANIPNLTALPYLDWCSAYDPLYLTTRAFVLSAANPYYYSGIYAQGLGSPHTPYGNVWPLGMIARALTATSAQEVAETVTELAQTDAENGLIHESFYADGYWRFTRADFGWANALYAELLFRTLAGYPAVPFTPFGTAVPFEIPSQTPVLVRPVVQLENAGIVVRALGDLLARRERRER
jgi:meiotically up-regulated gene 157 (Mug157) protein